MNGIYHQPFGNKIKTGFAYISAGTPYAANNGTNALFRESGNGGTAGVVTLLHDDLSIFTTDNSMSTGVTYLTPASNIKYLEIYAALRWAANATPLREFYLARYNTPTSPTTISPQIRIYDFVSNGTFGTQLYITTGLREVKSSGNFDGKFSINDNYMFYGRQTSGGNLNLTITDCFMGYTAYLG